MSRHRRNPIAGTLKGLPHAALKGFNLPTLKTAATVVAGSFATTFIANKLIDKLPMLGSNKFTKIATTLLTAGLVGYAAKKVSPARANELFAGGMISGVTQGVAEIFPQVKGIGMSDYADELGQNWNLGDFADPRQMQNAFPAAQPIGDFTSVPQVGRAFSAHQPMNINGLAESMVGEEIALM